MQRDCWQMRHRHARVLRLTCDLIFARSNSNSLRGVDGGCFYCGLPFPKFCACFPSRFAGIQRVTKHAPAFLSPTTPHPCPCFVQSPPPYPGRVASHLVSVPCSPGALSFSFPSRHAGQVDLVRTAARAKFDEALASLRVNPDVGKQMMEALQVLDSAARRSYFYAAAVGGLAVKRNEVTVPYRCHMDGERRRGGGGTRESYPAVCGGWCCSVHCILSGACGQACGQECGGAFWEMSTRLHNHPQWTTTDQSRNVTDD